MPLAPPGPLFPTIEGDEPGSEPNQPDPLPPQGGPDLMPASDALIPANQMDNASNSPAGAPQSGNIPPAGDHGPRRGRSLQDRINTLTRQRHEALDENADLRAQLQEILATQRQQMAPAPRSTSQSQNSSPDPHQIDQGDTSPLTVDSVRRVVSEAIETYASREARQKAEHAQLANAQQQSFQAAAEEFPELNDPASPAHRTFMQLYSQSPLKTLPDAPYQIALQVRGLLADQAQSVRGVESRKVAATIIEPSPAMQDIGPAQANASQAQKTYEDMNAIQKQRRMTFAEYKAWRNAREVLKTSR
jgi:hypothetical protein